MYVRKTIDVDEIKKEANRLLACKENELINKEFKDGVVVLLEFILNKSGNYRGYEFIDWKNGGCSEWLKNGMPNDNREYLGDENKRFYF